MKTINHEPTPDLHRLLGEADRARSKINDVSGTILRFYDLGLGSRGDGSIYKLTMIAARIRDMEVIIEAEIKGRETPPKVKVIALLGEIIRHKEGCACNYCDSHGRRFGTILRRADDNSSIITLYEDTIAGSLEAVRQYARDNNLEIIKEV